MLSDLGCETIYIGESDGQLPSNWRFGLVVWWLGSGVPSTRYKKISSSIPKPIQTTNSGYPEIGKGQGCRDPLKRNQLDASHSMALAGLGGCHCYMYACNLPGTLFWLGSPKQFINWGEINIWAKFHFSFVSPLSFRDFLLCYFQHIRSYGSLMLAGDPLYCTGSATCPCFGAAKIDGNPWVLDAISRA